MKKLLLILIVLYAFKPIFPLASYAIHYDYIVNELCVNRNKPSLHCNGKCHLMKEVGKLSDNDKKDVKFPISEYVQIVVPIFEFDFKKNIIIPSKKIKYFYQNQYFFDYFSKIFHPPSI